MFGIVIVAHDGLAREILLAMEHVVGHQEAIIAVGAASNCDRCSKEDEICKAINTVDQGDGVVVIVDLFGASPSNLAKKACIGANRKFIYGMNMPALIKLVKSRSSGMEKAVEYALQAGRKYIDVIDEKAHS